MAERQQYEGEGSESANDLVAPGAGRTSDRRAEARAEARSEALAEAKERVAEVAQRTNQSSTVRGIARAGLAANGLVHMLIGFIALTIAWGGSGSADQSGALAAVAAGPGGTLVLWIAGVALLGLALWQLTLVVWETAPNWRTLQFRRLKDVGKAMGFSGMGIASLYFAIGGRSDSAENSRTFSQVMLGSPGGIIVLCAVGGTVAGVGFGLIYRGVSQNFREDFETPGSPFTDRVVRVFGVVGHVSKGTALVVVGGLFVAAAVFADPEQAGGLDGALKYVAALPAGTILLTLVATGFILYGFYLFARARYLRRV